MSALGRTQLICSALFGALVISCGGPPVYVVAPPAPQGGLAQAAEPGRKAQEPQGGQRRPSGDPPGIRAPDIPVDGKSLDKSQWDSEIAKACRRANYGPRCLGVNYRFYDENGKSISDPGSDLYYNCEINRTPDGPKYMKLGSNILVESNCTLPESSTSSTPAEPDETKTSDQQPGNDKLNQQSDNNKSNQQSENEKNAGDKAAESDSGHTPKQQSDKQEDYTGQDGSGG